MPSTSIYHASLMTRSLEHLYPVALLPGAISPNLLGSKHRTDD